jgi:ribonuclease HII
VVARGRSKEPASNDAALSHERLLWDLGFRAVAGVDEVGLGPLAGPVVAAAVIFAPGAAALAGIDDSKKLAPARREELSGVVREHAIAIGIGLVEVAEIDSLGVHKAGLEAMRRAVTALSPAADYLLVDARQVPEVTVGQSAYIRGDGIIYSIGAASIVAKVHRDALMRSFDGEYPGYGFADHMGYSTPAHLSALERLGACPLHRRSFEPVRAVIARGETPTTLHP